MKGIVWAKGRYYTALSSVIQVSVTSNGTYYTATGQVCVFVIDYYVKNCVCYPDFNFAV